MSVYLNSLEAAAQVRHWAIIATMTPFEQEKYLEMLDSQYQTQATTRAETNVETKENQTREEARLQEFKRKAKSYTIKPKMIQAFGLRTKAKNDPKIFMKSRQHSKNLYATTTTTQIITKPLVDGIPVESNTADNGSSDLQTSKETSAVQKMTLIRQPPCFVKRVRGPHNKPKVLSADLTRLSIGDKQHRMKTFLQEQQQNGYISKIQISESLNKETDETKNTNKETLMENQDNVEEEEKLDETTEFDLSTTITLNLSSLFEISDEAESNCEVVDLETLSKNTAKANDINNSNNMFLQSPITTMCVEEGDSDSTAVISDTVSEFSSFSTFS